MATDVEIFVSAPYTFEINAHVDRNQGQYHEIANLCGARAINRQERLCRRHDVTADLCRSVCRIVAATRMKEIVYPGSLDVQLERDHAADSRERAHHR